MKSKKFLLVILVCFALSGCTSQNDIQEEVAAIVESYNAGNITYDNAVSEINSFLSENSVSDETNNYINEQLAFLDELNESKTNYEKANEEFENADYEDAMEYYEMVIEKDDNYENAQSQIEESQDKYIEVADQQAQIYIDDEKYLKAIEVYESAQKVYDDGSIDGKIADIKESYKASLEATALEYENSKEWGSAISTYETLYDYFKDESYQVNITDVTNKCINAAIEEAEQYLSEGNTADAKVAIQTAKIHVGDDNELEDEITRIESFEPVSLMDLDTFYEDTHLCDIYDWDEDDADNLGNSYEKGIEIFTGLGRIDYEATLSYMINGEYDTLNGSYVLHQDCKDYIDEINENQIFIYGDDKLLYTSGNLKGGVTPEDINIDISGVLELKIVFKGYHPGYNYSLSLVGFVEPTLQKEYTPLD